MPEEKIKLDIGSGRSKFQGYFTIDKDPSVKADFDFDIENSDFFFWNEYFSNSAGNKRFSVGEIDEIRAHHILEHLRSENKVKVMAVFYRLLKSEGILDIEVPLFPHPASVQDPTHLSFWTRESFWYFIKGNKFGEAFAKRYSEYPVPLFEFVSDETRGDEKNPWAYRIILKKV